MNCLLFVDESDEERAKTIREFGKMLGERVVILEASNTEQADELIMEYMSETGQLPNLIVTEYLVPDSTGCYQVYPRNVHAMYPEMPMVLITNRPAKPAASSRKRKIQLAGVLDKPWTEENKAALSRTIVKAL